MQDRNSKRVCLNRVNVEWKNLHFEWLGRQSTNFREVEVVQGRVRLISLFFLLYPFLLLESDNGNEIPT